MTGTHAEILSQRANSAFLEVMDIKISDKRRAQTHLDRGSTTKKGSSIRDQFYKQVKFYERAVHYNKGDPKDEVRQIINVFEQNTDAKQAKRIYRRLEALLIKRIVSNCPCGSFCFGNACFCRDQCHMERNRHGKFAFLPLKGYEPPVWNVER